MLREPALHVGRTYDLTVPEDISLARAVHELTGREPPGLARFLAEAQQIQAFGCLPGRAPLRY